MGSATRWIRGKDSSQIVPCSRQSTTRDERNAAKRRLPPLDPAGERPAKAVEREFKLVCKNAVRSRNTSAGGADVAHRSRKNPLNSMKAYQPQPVGRRALHPTSFAHGEILPIPSSNRGKPAIALRNKVSRSRPPAGKQKSPQPDVCGMR